MDVDNAPSREGSMDMDCEPSLQKGNEGNKLIVPLPGTYFAFQLKYNPILFSGKQVDDCVYVAYLEEIFGVPLPSQLRPFHICRIRMLHCEPPSVDHKTFLRDNPIPVSPSDSARFEHEPLLAKPDLPIRNCYHLPYTDTLVRIETAEESDALDPSEASVLPVPQMKRVLDISENTQTKEESNEDDMVYRVLPLITVVDVNHNESGDKIRNGRRLSLRGLQHFSNPVQYFDDVAYLEDFIDEILTVVNTIRGPLDEFNKSTESSSGQASIGLKQLVQDTLERHPAIYNSLDTGSSSEGVITIKQWQSHFDRLLWESNLEKLVGELTRLTRILEITIISAHSKQQTNKHVSGSVQERLPDYDEPHPVQEPLPDRTKPSLDRLAADVLLDLGQPSENLQEIDHLRECLLHLLNDKYEYQYAKTIASDQMKAISLVNLLDWILKTMAVPFDPLYERRLDIRRLMFKISKDANVYPESFYVKDIEWNMNNQIDGGFRSDTFVMRWMGEEVCVKRLQVFDQTNLQELWRDFCRETMIWQQLDHPRILKLLGVIAQPEAKRLCIVTPWIRGGNLINFQHKCGPENINPIPLLIQVAEGLVWMHEEGVIHGNIKAPNILVDEEGNIKITDLGVTFIVDATEGHTGSSDGTLRYVAPELIGPKFGRNQRQATPQSDVYSLAHTMVETYTLKSPFPEEPMPFVVMNRVLNGDRPSLPPPAQCYGREIPNALWGLITQSWCQTSEDRPEMSYILSELRGMVNTE